MQIVKLREYDKNTNKESVNEYIVASTKTKNILVDTKVASGLYVAVLDTKEFYLDREFALELGKQASEKLGLDITNNIINALEVACIVKRLDK